MVIAVLANEEQKGGLLSRHTSPGVEWVWADSLRSLAIIDADAYFDLLFEYEPERIARLKQLLPRPVVVHSIIHTTAEIAQPFTRINAWPGMLDRPLLELANGHPSRDAEIRALFSTLGWECSIVPDITGMTTPRLLAILHRELSTSFGNADARAQAGRLLTPQGATAGPVDWIEKIGAEQLGRLLTALSRNDSRYIIAPDLTNTVHGTDTQH